MGLKARQRAYLLNGLLILTPVPVPDPVPKPPEDSVECVRCSSVDRVEKDIHGIEREANHLGGDKRHFLHPCEVCEVYLT